MLFGSPEVLFLLGTVPFLTLIAWLAALARRRRVRAWGNPALWERLSPGRSSLLRGLKLAAALAALGLGWVAAARPQVGAQLVEVERRGIDVVVALDVSLSMEATDVVPSRLERSRLEIRELVDGLRGDRLGIVIFSGTSFLLCPLTLDAVAANLFLDAVSPDVLPDPGTNLEEAIQGALGAFGEETTGRGRAIILFTDGESHAGDAMAAAGVCGERGIPVITVGVGTPSGEPIPIRDRTGKRVGYKKDRASEVVLSRLDEATLREVARVSGGEYFPATLQGHEVEEMIAWLHRLEKGELGGAFRRRVEERFQIPLGIGLVLLVLALITPEARRRETA